MFTIHICILFAFKTRLFFKQYLIQIKTTVLFTLILGPFFVGCPWIYEKVIQNQVVLTLLLTSRTLILYSKLLHFTTYIKVVHTSQVPKVLMKSH